MLEKVATLEGWSFTHRQGSPHQSEETAVVDRVTIGSDVTSLVRHCCAQVLHNLEY